MSESTTNVSEEPTGDALLCPPEYETATDVYEASAVDGDDCAGCGCPKADHKPGPPPAERTLC